MNFNTLQFGLFLCLAYAVYWSLRSRTARTRFLLAASYLFYASWNVWYVPLILGVTAVNYAAGLFMQAREPKSAGRKRWLAVSLVVSIGVLAVFKYFNFFADNLNDFFGAAGLEILIAPSRLALPVGVSFYTFQSMSYAIDVYQGRIAAERSARDFFLYVAFFPQLVAGPIVRAEFLLPRLKSDVVFDEARALRGLFMVMAGLFKKIVIADLIARTVVDQAFAHPGQATLLQAWLGMYGYAIQIYMDFSGYTDVALGCGLMLGFELPKNFIRPYLAVDLRDFWRRWHVTFSTWLRDYLYISLGGSRRGRFRMYFAIMITMLLGGLWHGAAWTLVLWGAYHGALLVVNRLLGGRPGEERNERNGAVKTWAKRLLTLHLVGFGWVLFRAETVGDAMSYYASMFEGPLTARGLPGEGAALIGFGFVLHFTPLSWKDRLAEAFRGLPKPVLGAILAVLLAIFSLAKTAGQPFIYFQF